MTTRHPPRMTTSHYEEDGSGLRFPTTDLDYEEPVARLAARRERRPGTIAFNSPAASVIDNLVEGNNRPIPDADAYFVPPAFATDFGPKTLTEYLRAEVDKLKREREATLGKGKGKQKETAVPAACGLLDTGKNQSPTHVLHSTPIAPTLSDRVNNRQLSVSVGTRRSERLARRDSSSQDATQSVSGSEKPQLPQPSLPTPPLPGPSEQPSVQRNCRISLPGTTSPSRTTTFEEHTKNKRMAVRNIAQEDLTSPLRAKLRQKRHSKGLSLSGPSSAVPSDIHCAGNPQHDQTQGSHPIPSSENNPTGSVPWLSSMPGQLATGNTIPQTPLNTLAPGVQNHQLSTQESPTSEDVTRIGSKDQCPSTIPFDYASIIPELIPQSEKKEFIEQATRAKRNHSADPDRRRLGLYRPRDINSLLEIAEEGVPPRLETPRARFFPDDVPGAEVSDPKWKNVSPPTPRKQHPRLWKPLNAPGMRLSSTRSTRIRSSKAVKALGSVSSAIQLFDVDLWTEICRFLSTQDVKNLRLVSKNLAEIVAPIQLRNVVVNFNRNFFDMTGGDWDSKSGWLPPNSMFKKYGADINQFGVSFEYDLQGLLHAKSKTIEKEQVAWFGKFTWPTEQYPRFPELQAIEDLVDDNRPLLREALGYITRASELGLCVDSGHGWLEGPDISDMALFNRRTTKGSKIFGKTFKNENVWTTFARNEYFRWAQQNTINETIKTLMAKQPPSGPALKEVRFLDGLKIRDIESFRHQDKQFDYDPECHVGVGPVFGVEAGLDQNGAPPNAINALDPAIHRQLLAHSRNGGRRLPQWPIIFSGYNLAAEHGGHSSVIQNKTAHPAVSPLLPGLLTEAQAQWLMETAWAQRVFLSAYTTAIITHKQNFKSIHTLRISKLSSGLLPSLEQWEFWKTLSGLKTLEIFISPDWREEHVMGDREFVKNMLICPSDAAKTFTTFLRRYITKLESLHSLTLGYTGGGEHAVGMFARNKHVLPAPIVEFPGDWLFDMTDVPGSPLVTKFDHVRELRFVNCWFTPWMLQDFMKSSRDTSLHSLTLDSVSMTTYHDADITRPITNLLSNIRCLHSREEWIRENLPSGAAWARVLDAITPGKTLLGHKYDAGLIDRELQPMPKSTFRGHVQQIILNSCGYVKISILGPSSDFNQNSAAIHFEPVTETALDVRKERFAKASSLESGQGAAAVDTQNVATHTSEKVDATNIMMSDAHYPWLGTLTQCIHPIEKRVLEEAWGMRFGWPNNIERWAAVEDGEFEGGTGRFTGVIKKTEQTIEEC
ncbi:uncharacterized protein A1O5_10324 [Cladophialophora psammophila CBS 110553]|uniref:F-box domain-containing protein n=1 Tax=Cladophialophora psammophila CBS 110553 TaxID=1182543 RepID=W9WFE0_9EURO|nr:uncharacterized protein A1O5_10324 [Cladophialophora psammophila CBS 110553]EXJ66653.1 hypothetical protein A1O5_10324 [Cladophialophora psammophila CBS 110553]